MSGDVSIEAASNPLAEVGFSRLMSMVRIVARTSVVLLGAALSLAPALGAQSVLGANANNPATPVKNSSMLKPPAGTKVAIIEWEDLECPACAHAFPIVHSEASHYHIPIVRYDFPLQMHIWSRDAAIFARYLQDDVSPDLAMEYRREVFASQMQITSKDDLTNFTRKFMQRAGKQMPFVLDPTGRYTTQVNQDYDLGVKMGLVHTPSIFVVTPTHWTEINDVSQLSNAIDQAEASVKEAPHAGARRGK